MDTESPAGHSPKADLRATLLAARARLDPAALAQADARRTARLLARLHRVHPDVVACYVSQGTEPGTAELLDDLLDAGVAILLPHLAHLTPPAWAWWSGEPLVAGAGGIPTPVTPPQPATVLGQADVIIVPGLAGSRAGVRLGRGGGWYDRALVHARPGAPRWLLLYDDEVVDDLPAAEHDQPVTDLVTPGGWITPGRTTAR